MHLTIEEIAAACSGRIVLPADAPASSCRSRFVEGVSWDSRTVGKGCMYVALPGERVDGHDFIEAAAKAGAACALVSREVDSSVPLVVVADTAAAFTALSGRWREKLAGTVIGLTGSVGKTSTKNLVRDVLSHSRSVVATLANQNNELGVPNTLLAADADTDAVVVEMGMRGKGQIAELCQIAKPDWGIVTNVGESHIELLGSRDNIACAKAELFEALPCGTGLAFVNASDDYAAWICDYAKLDERGVTAVFYDGSGDRHALQEGGPAVWATDVVFDSEGRPAFTLNAHDVPVASAEGALSGQIACKLELRGAHNVTNACAAAAVGFASGMTLEQVRDALAAALPEQGRQQITLTKEGVTVFDDSYNASPDSMQASLNTFKSMSVEGRRIAVLGDMLELGDFARECHERVGVMAANADLDRLVCVGELSRHMARAAREAGLDPKKISTCDDAEQALALIAPRLESGDAVLAKASHSIGLDRIVKGLVG